MPSALDDRPVPGTSDREAPAAVNAVDSATVRQFIHQMRSHLTAIGPAAEFIADPAGGDEVREEMLEIVRQAVARIEGLLADLSIVAVPERVYLGSVASVVSLEEVARAAVSGQMQYAQTLGAWLVVDADACPPVLGHDVALRQAAGNAVALVLRLARTGDRVQVRVRPAMDGMRPGIELSVELQPTGGGERGSRPPDFEGVALSAARIIAEQHGGALTIATERPALVMHLPAAPLNLGTAAVGAAGAGLLAQSSRAVSG